MIHVESDEAGLEQRLSSLQTQIDLLRQAGTDDARPLEQRLSTLTEYSTSILKQWAATADRHAKAVSQLESHLHELGDASTRLQQDASQRLQDLERIVHQEWNALRDLHEAPVRQLVEQAASLTEVCIATANSAQHGFDRAEARLTTLEADFHRTASELTRELQTVLSEVRQLSAAGQRQLAGEPPAWPLEGVTRLHQQLRESAAAPKALPASVDAQEPVTVTPGEPVGSRPEPVTRQEDPLPIAFNPEPARGASFSRASVVVVLVVLVVVAGLFAWRLQRDMQAVSAQAEQSRQQSRSAEEASREAARKQEAADRQLVAAGDLAARAQAIGDVLAAPDLVRFALVGSPVLPTASGQVLWSRSRGFVFSGSGLPVPPPNTTYQIWLLTRGGAVSAGTFAPDAAGRATVTATLNIPRPINGAIVTTERAGGAETPSGEPVMARLPAPPAQS